MKKLDKQPMKGLTVKQPWANQILYTGKDIENRDTRWNVTGTIALHAGLQVTKDVYLPKGYKKHLVLGAIIGVVDIIECVEKHDSPCFKGPYGYVLENPRPLPKPIPYKGQLGFWNVSPEAEKEIRKQLKGRI
jgi:hypothetical protein